MARAAHLPDRFTLALVATVVVAAARPAHGGWIARREAPLSLVDRGSIPFVVYAALSAAVVEGLWSHVPLRALFGLVDATPAAMADAR